MYFKGIENFKNYKTLLNNYLFSNREKYHHFFFNQWIDLDKFVLSFIIIIIIVLLYKFIFNDLFDMSINELLIIIISFSICFAVSMFVLDKFQFSNNKIIKFIQKFIFYIFFLLSINIFLGVFISETIYCEPTDSNNSNNNNTNTNKNNNSDSKNILKIESDETDYNIKNNKKVFNTVITNSKDIVKQIFNQSIPDIGTSAAAVSIGAATLKSTSGMRVRQRLAFTGGAVFIGAASTHLGITGSKQITKN